MISFKTEFANSVDVAHCSVYSFGGKPVTSAADITKDAGVTRNSYLCYIKFQSLVNPTNTTFYMAYRVKAHSKYVRNKEQNRCKWFLTFKDNSSGRMELLDREMAKVVFDFDVDKFFQTQFFQSCVAMMKTKVQAGIEKAREYLKANPKDVPACADGLRGIESGLQQLDEPPVFNDMGSIKEVDPRQRDNGSNFDQATQDRLAMFWQQKDKFAGQERGPSMSQIRKAQQAQARQDAAIKKRIAQQNRNIDRLVKTLGKED